MTLAQNADRLLTEATESRAIPGVVAMATTADETIYQGAFGKASLAGDAGMELDTVFHIASMTKALTGAAAMQLVEQGRVGLDQPAGEIIGQLGSPLVLDGFDAAGAPKLRPARGAHRPVGGAEGAPRHRSRHPLGVRHQHRLDRAHRRGGQWREPR